MEQPQHAKNSTTTCCIAFEYCGCRITTDSAREQKQTNWYVCVRACVYVYSKEKSLFRINSVQFFRAVDHSIVFYTIWLGFSGWFYFANLYSMHSMCFSSSIAFIIVVVVVVVGVVVGLLFCILHT